MLKKLLVAGVMMTLVLTVLAGAPAVTSAQSMSLCQTVDALVLAGVIAPDKVAAAKAAAGCTATAGATSFTRNLTIGSTGADVTALQNMIGVSPATGYFGAITKAAVMKYQAANGVSATGFVGPLTLAKLNGSVTTTTTTTTTTTCPAGMTCTPTAAVCPAGYTCTSNTGAVTTTGTEGSIVVTQTSVGLPTSIYEGDTKAGVLAFKVEAKNSDVSVQRVAIDLGTTTRIYNKVLSKIYVMDGSTVLASSDLNVDTVTKDSATVPHYYINMTGMNVVVAKGTTKVLTIAVDVKSTVDSAYKSANFPIALYGPGTTATAVRAVDGAGLDQYDGAGYLGTSLAGVYKNLSVSSVLADTATLSLSTDSSTPDATSIIASEGTNNDQIDGVTLLTFNLQAKKDAVKVTDLTVSAHPSSGTAADLETVYLYDGSTQLDSGSITSSSAGGTVTFSNLDIVVAKDTTKTFTVKADVRNANTATVWSATTTASYITAENSLGTSIVPTGSATGNAITFSKTGPQITLISKSVGTKSTVNNTNGTATSTQDFNFKVRVTAVGSAVTLGGSASSTAAFLSATATGLNVYLGSSLQNLGGGVSLAANASYFAPTSGVTTSGSGASEVFTIAEGQSADFDVTYSLTVPSAHTGSWSVGLKGIIVDGTTVNFMNGLSAWRTSAVQLP